MTPGLMRELYELFRREAHTARDADEYEHLRSCAQHWLLRSIEEEDGVHAEKGVVL